MMRPGPLGIVFATGIAAIVLALTMSAPQVQAERQVGHLRSELASEDLIAMPGPTSEGNQVFVIIDRARRTMGTYQVGGSGQIKLLSVRNLIADLQMDNFNGMEPSPEKIRALSHDQDIDR